MSQSTKDVIIKELKQMVDKENLNIEDMLEMLEYAKTFELILFKRSIDRIFNDWKKNRNLLKIGSRIKSTKNKKVVNL